MLFLVFFLLFTFTACRQNVKDSAGNQTKEITLPVLTRLSVAGQNFSDLSKTSFTVSKEQEANVESVEVIAEASAGTNVSFNPVLNAGKWKIQSGLNILAITLNNGRTNTYTVALNKKNLSPTEELPKLLSLTVNGERRDNPPLVADFYTVPNGTSSVKVKAEPESGAVPAFTPSLAGADADIWNLDEGQNTLSIRLVKNAKETTYTVKLFRLGTAAPALELKKLEVGKTKFTDLTSSKLLNAESVSEDKVKVIAEADAGIAISFDPPLGSEDCWALPDLGEHTLKIKLTRGTGPSVVYTVKILRKETGTSLFQYIEDIKYATSDYGTAFPTDFNVWKSCLLKEENGSFFCILDSIYPEDYLGFIFILKSGASEIAEVKQKSMKANTYTKMYCTPNAAVSENTAEPYFVYYFSKYSFSKIYSETAMILITYKDGKSDEFTVKATNGVISE